MARNGRPRATPTEDQIEQVRAAYLRTGDLAGACAEVGVKYDSIEALAEADRWADDRAKVREQRTLDTIADQHEQDRSKRRANALHREIAEDALITVRRQFRDKWLPEIREMNASDGARVFKALGEAVKSFQFVHRIALGMDTEKVGSESTDELLARIKEAKRRADDLVNGRINREPASGADSAPATSPNPTV